MRNKQKLTMSLPHTFSQAELRTFIASSSYSYPSSGTRRIGNEQLRSVRNSSSLLSFPPHIFPQLQYGSSAWATVPQDKTASAQVLHGPQFLQEYLLLHGFLPTVPVMNLLQHGFSPCFSFLQGISTCCDMAFPMGCSVGISSTVVLSTSCR